MTHHSPLALCLLLLALVAAGCRTPPLASRPLTPREMEWAMTIQRSYPHWQPPFFMPTRQDWEPRPTTAPVMVPLVPSPVPAATAAPVSVKETVVEVPLPPAAALLPPVKAEAPHGAPTEPRVATPKLLVEPEMNDVEFVPAD